MPDYLSYLLWVAVGGGAGGAARFAVTGFVARLAGDAFPWGTLVVNGSGAAAVGMVAAALDAGLLAGRPAVTALLVVGFLASYTTVAAVSLQTLALAQQGRGMQAAANLGLSLVLCLGAVAGGYAAAAALLGMGP